MTIETTSANAFGRACAFERPIERIRNFTAAIARIAPSIGDEQVASILQQLALEIEESVEELDGIHGFFFALHHPARNPAGWQEVDGVQLPPIKWAKP